MLYRTCICQTMDFMVLLGMEVKFAYDDRNFYARFFLPLQHSRCVSLLVFYVLWLMMSRKSFNIAPQTQTINIILGVWMDFFDFWHRCCVEVNAYWNYIFPSRNVRSANRSHPNIMQSQGKNKYVRFANIVIWAFCKDLNVFYVVSVHFN